MSEEKTMWIVGKWRGGDELNSVWDINGVFDSEEKAIEACDNRPHYFVAPLTLNKSSSDETTKWSGCYYPSLRTA